MGGNARLQPIEIHPGMQQAIDGWNEHANDTSFLNTLVEDGKELGSLSSSLQQANMAWCLSTLLDELALRPDIMNTLRPLSAGLPLDFQLLFQADFLTSNSVIYRTFVSVVLGRTDKFVDAINQIAKRNPSKQFSAAIKLLRNDEVRKLRNAIGHGTFEAKMQIMDYNNGTHQRRIAFRELDSLNSAIWSIVLSGLAASYKWSSGLHD